MISFHAMDDQIVYLGTRTQGVYVSEDGGVTFESVSVSLPDQSITALTSGPGSPSVIWAGTPSGVYKTLDGGGTWLPDNAGLENRHVLSLDVDQEAWIIRVGTYAGGVSWSVINHQDIDEGPASPSQLRLSIAPVPSRRLISITPFPRANTSHDTLDIALYSLGGR